MKGFTGEIPKAQRILAKGLRKAGIEFEENCICEGYEADILICHANVIIEVDGLYHLSKSQREVDLKKTALWERKGYRVFRFTNRQIQEDLTRCLHQVVNWVDNYRRIKLDKEFSHNLSGDKKLRTLRQNLIRQECQAKGIRHGESIEAFFLRQGQGTDDEIDGEGR